MKSLSKKITLLCMVVILTACAAPAQPTQAPAPSAPMTPVTTEMDNGLTWTECILPEGEYSAADADLEVITKCLNTTLPSLGADDNKIFGERIPGDSGDNFRLAIGSDVYETKYNPQGDGIHFDYELLKNSAVIAKTTAAFGTFPPNLNLANIGGKAVWEIAAEPHAIFVDGVNFNEKYQLEGSFIPYEIKGKLVYIAQKGGKQHVVYDDKTIGPEFDKISMAFCCAEMTVFYGQGRYLFIGKRDGKQFAVVIQ